MPRPIGEKITHSGHTDGVAYYNYPYLTQKVGETYDGFKNLAL
jgi:hypothetical protein